MTIESEWLEIMDVWHSIEDDTKFELANIYLDKEKHELKVMSAEIEDLAAKVLHLMRIIRDSKGDIAEMHEHKKHLLSLIHHVEPTREWQREIKEELNELAQEIKAARDKAISIELARQKAAIIIRDRKARRLQSISQLEVKNGTWLGEIYSLFEPSTIKHAHEIMALRKFIPNLSRESLFTADFSMYRVEDGEVFLYFAPREYNLIFRDIENAADQLQSTGFYIPPKEGVDEVVAAAREGKVLKTKVSDLQLQKVMNNDYRYGYFDVDFDNIDSLNLARSQLVQAIYGTPWPDTKVSVLYPEYVKMSYRGGCDALATYSKLAWIMGFSEFSAMGNFYRVQHGLLGVLKEEYREPEKEAPKANRSEWEIIKSSYNSGAFDIFRLLESLQNTAWMQGQAVDVVLLPEVTLFIADAINKDRALISNRSSFKRFSLTITMIFHPDRHNILNASGQVIAGHELQVTFDKIYKIFNQFIQDSQNNAVRGFIDPTHIRRLRREILQALKEG